MNNRAEKGTRSIDYGINYLPSIELIEHFGPFWIENRMSIEQLRCDLLCMRAMNCRFIRFHLMPANYQRDCMPGENVEQSQRIIDWAVRYALDLGLHVHYDIWSSDRMNITPQEVTDVVSKFAGLGLSYQIGNEQYFSWRDDEHIRHVEKLIAAGKQTDPASRWCVDIWPGDLARVRDKFPSLYKMLDFIAIHFYATGDYRGWSPIYYEQLVHFCGGDNEFPGNITDERFIQSDFFVGSYKEFDKEKWITEITACGYHRFGAVIDENAKGEYWREVCRNVAERTDLKAVGHHNLRDKMSWREVGTSQCGLIYMDGSPKPSAHAFKEMAKKSLPDGDLAKWIDASVSAEGDSARLTLKSRLKKPISGKASFAVCGFLQSPQESVDVTIPPGGEITVEQSLSRVASRYVTSQLFGAFVAPSWGKTGCSTVAWSTHTRPAEIRIDQTIPPLRNVRYPTGLDSVQDFLRTYDSIAILTADLIGFDGEMAHRLASVLRGAMGKAVDLAATINAYKVIDRPMILLGNPRYHYFARLAELAADRTCRLSEANPCFVARLDWPFKPKSRASAIANAIGYAISPACLYIAGLDEQTLQRATYDLIRRIWIDKAVEVFDSPPGISPIVSQESRRFRVDLSPGAYRVTFTVGQDAGPKRVTIVDIDGQGILGPIVSNGKTSRHTVETYCENGIMTIGFSSIAGESWAIAELELAHAGLLAEDRKFFFSTGKNKPPFAAEVRLVLPETPYKPTRRYGWLGQ